MRRIPRATFIAVPLHAGLPGAVSGRHRIQGRKPARSAAAAVGKNSTFSDFAGRTWHAAGVYHGWLVVGAAFLVALFGWGLGFYGPGIYLVALQNRHGWSTAAISSAITTYYLLGATLVFFAGTIFERFGVRRVVSAGTVAMGCGVVLLALTTACWQIHAAFAVMSLGCNERRRYQHHCSALVR